MAKDPPGALVPSIAPRSSFAAGEAGDERDDAVRRLDAALVEQDQWRESRRAAIGTSSEIGAYAGSLVAREEVAVLQDLLRSSDSDAGGGRVWLNGREVGGTDSRYLGLEDSHD